MASVHSLHIHSKRQSRLYPTLSSITAHFSAKNECQLDLSLSLSVSPSKAMQAWSTHYNLHHCSLFLLKALVKPQ